jgi:hypothetical protein
MATALDQIIPVSIQLGSIVPSQVSFSIPMIAAQFNSTKGTSFTGRTKVYVSLAGLRADGWLPTDDVYLYAQALLSQNPSVQRFVVGRRTVSPDAAPDADWAAALTAIQAEDPNWYGFVVVPITPATPITEQLQIAAWAETAHRPFFTDSPDAAILASGTSDAASQVSALLCNYTMVTYHAATTPHESASAAWLGFLLPLNLGSWNPAYRQLAAITPDAITVGQKVVAWGKFCNTFSTVAGLNLTERGYVAGGTYKYIDITFGIDWLNTNLQTAYLQVLASPQKVPFTDAGGILLKSVADGVMATAAAMGIVDPASVTVTVPKVATISSGDKATRNFPGITILARVQGAVNIVPVSLTLSF